MKAAAVSTLLFVVLWALWERNGRKQAEHGKRFYLDAWKRSRKHTGWLAKQWSASNYKVNRLLAIRRAQNDRLASHGLPGITSEEIVHAIEQQAERVAATLLEAVARNGGTKALERVARGGPLYAHTDRPDRKMAFVVVGPHGDLHHELGASFHVTPASAPDTSDSSDDDPNTSRETSL